MDIKKQIIKDISEDCDHYSELGYDCWKHLLSDANMENREEYDKVLYEEFTEDELEELWKNSHNNKVVF